MNGKPAKLGTIIQNGDRIENIVHRHEPPVTSIPVKVIKEDREKEFIVIDKPGSIVSSHRGPVNVRSIDASQACACSRALLQEQLDRDPAERIRVQQSVP